MRAGKLRNKVEIQSCQFSANDYGEKRKIWSTEATRRFEIENLKAKHKNEGVQATIATTHEFIGRGYDLDPTTHRLKWNGKYFQIIIVRRQNEIDADMVLECVELVGGSTPAEEEVIMSGSPVGLLLSVTRTN